MFRLTSALTKLLPPAVVRASPSQHPAQRNPPERLPAATGAQPVTADSSPGLTPRIHPVNLPPRKTAEEIPSSGNPVQPIRAGICDYPIHGFQSEIIQVYTASNKREELTGCMRFAIDLIHVCFFCRTPNVNRHCYLTWLLRFAFGASLLLLSPYRSR